MKKKSGGTQETEELRQRAELELATHWDPVTDPLMTDEKRLLHELQVHQIELEMQNEALLEALNRADEARSTAELAQAGYAELFDFAPIAYFSLGKEGVIRKTNLRGANLLGIERSLIAGQDFTQWVSREYRTVFNRFLEAVFANDDTHRCEVTLQLGETPCYVAIEAIADKTRQTCLAAVSDISERKRTEAELQLAATIYMALGEAIVVADKDNRIIAINPAFSRLTGYSAKEIIGRPTSFLKTMGHNKTFYQDLWETLNASGRWDGEIGLRGKNGDVQKWLSISSVFDVDGKVVRRVGMFSDMSEKRRAEAIIRKQANIDPLTELPNRRLLYDRLQQAIHKSHREQQKLALLFLDLDHFKDINDTLGHDIGDSLLKEIAERLKSCIRETDTLARLGGDEFTLILGELDEMNSIERVARGIQRQMTQPFHLGNELCTVTFSMGIAICPDDSSDLENLLKKADQAMYAAKHHGRNRFCFFTPLMQEVAENRLRLSNDLRNAFIDQQFWVAYQPIVELATGHIQKAEALIRWQHPTRGLVPPTEFIHIAEDTGVIIELGEWVFQQAAHQVKQWREILHPNFQISVNKSPVQFLNNRTCQAAWFEILQSLGLPGVSISVEITERLLLEDSPIVSEQLIAYRDTGMQVSLDDFGTGYSSLSYLKKFEIDFLKIDQSFVSHLSANSTDRVLCEAVILMAHKLGMKVIAEGIETPEQRDLLRQVGCDYGQGYLFSRPVSAEAFERFYSTPGQPHLD